MELNSLTELTKEYQYVNNLIEFAKRWDKFLIIKEGYSLEQRIEKAIRKSLGYALFLSKLGPLMPDFCKRCKEIDFNFPDNMFCKEVEFKVYVNCIVTTFSSEEINNCFVKEAKDCLHL